MASDGVWDELSPAEAVQTVAESLMTAGAQGPNIATIAADKLVEMTLEHAHQRIINSIDEEAETTLENMKARPAGKRDSYPYGRSLLHDDITAIVLVFATDTKDNHACLANRRAVLHCGRCTTEFAKMLNANTPAPASSLSAGCDADSGTNSTCERIDPKRNTVANARLRRQTVDSIDDQITATVFANNVELGT